jgi:type II secretory pathway component GspD/PulD (secretin)
MAFELLLQEPMKIAALLVMLSFSAPLAADAAPAKNHVGNSCRQLPAGKRIVRLNLKPNTDLGDLISWISSITCKQFVVPGTIPVSTKTVTIVSPQLITVEEAYGLFLTALETVGLTVYPVHNFFRVIESGKAKISPIPLFISDVADAASDAAAAKDH